MVSVSDEAIADNKEFLPDCFVALLAIVSAVALWIASPQMLERNGLTSAVFSAESLSDQTRNN